MTEEAPLQQTLAHLRALVAFDTTNPPRDIPADSGVVAYAADRLEAAGFHVSITDLGQGCVILYALRGRPAVLFNVHLDTVPADPAYTADPFTLRVDDEVATGLGACDIKGAAACLLTAAETTTHPMAILFTTDEEAGSSTCVHHFCDTPPDGLRDSLEAVIVAEPTSGRAVMGHRGIRTFTGTFHGTAGHSSGPTALEDSALHRAAAWVHDAVALAREHRRSMTFEELRGSCFNVGVLQGGKKPNIVAPSAHVRWGVRPLPGQDAKHLAGLYKDLAEPSHVTWQDGFIGPSLPSTDAARAFAASRSLPTAPPVDFWTEAALFAAAGFPTLVLGPGHISQAHTADESVPLADLRAVTELYSQIR